MTITTERTIELVTISPAYANELLESNSLNRNIRDHKVTQYATSMKQGRWVVNGESIKVSKTGRLLDGQHRLWACVEAETDFKTYLVTGLADEVFSTIDTGLPRDAATVVGIAGYKNANIQTAAARWIYGFKTKQAKHKAGTAGLQLMQDQLLQLVASYQPRLSESVSYCMKLRTVGFPAVFAALHYLISEHSPEEADAFIDDVASGANLDAGDPVLKLRERLLARKHSNDPRHKVTSIVAMNLVVRAWNARKEGRTLKMLQSGRRQGGDMLAPRLGKKEEPDTALTVNLD